MVDYVSTNALSMLGGDDYGDITADIAALDASVVHRTGNLNETINGVKTFTSDFVINNANTDIISSVRAIISAPVVYLNGTQNRVGSSLAVGSTLVGNKIDCVGGYNLMTSGTTSALANQIEATGGASNAMTTTGAGNNVFNAQGSGNNNFISQTGKNTLTAGSAAADANLIQATTALGGNTIKTTTGDNTITTTGGSNLMEVQFGTGSNRIIANANSNLNNEVNGFNNFILANDTNYLSAPNNSIVSTTTSLSASNLIDATGTGGGNTIRSATGLNTITSAKTSANANIIEATGSAGSNTIKNTTGTNLLTTISGTNRISNGTGDNIMEITFNGLGGNKLIANASSNGFNSIIGWNNYYDVNSSHYIRVGSTPVNRIVVDSSLTTITNTDVDIVGSCNSTRYQLGTSITKKPLSSMIMGVGHCQITLPNVAATTTSTTNGTWLGGTTFFRTPDYGVFVPTFITVTYSGTFTGGALAIHRFEVINNSTGGTIIASTGNSAYTSAMTTNTLGDTNFITTGNFSAGNLFTVRCVINTGVAAITASTKVAYLQVYGYQLNP